MGQNVRAKFKCSEISQFEYGTKVTLQAVSSSEGENKDFAAATPAGTFSMHIEKGRAAEKAFEVGTSYYIDISEVPAARGQGTLSSPVNPPKPFGDRPVG